LNWKEPFLPPNGSAVNILLVDDEPANLLVLESVLGGMGYNLVKARSGEEALRNLIRKDFAVIVLDVVMPGMDGFETASLIRQRDRSRHTPIIFLTAAGKTDAEMFEGYAVGAIDYLLKPLHPEILRSKVSGLVDLYLKTEQVRGLNEELGRRAAELESMNLLLKKENQMRRSIEGDLRDLNLNLEAQVHDRTAVLEERSLQLSKSNEELQQFAYVASHDLQEPLRTIVSYLQLLDLRYSGAFDAEAKTFMGFVVSAAKHMRDLISGLLEYSKVSSLERAFEDVDCGPLLDRVLENLKASILDKKARVLRGNLPSVRGDPLLLELLFQNLIANALKFNNRRDPTVEVAAEPRGEEWLFWVKDNGIGMESKYLDRIFIIFQRLHNREDYPGTGLGLAVCKKTVERHGGRIWCESEPGKGSCFYFTVPSGGKTQRPELAKRKWGGNEEGKARDRPPSKAS
jgi:two-component system, sensor histidine kinase and response regulator